MIGKLTRVALRDVWKHEARDLTRWLTENPDVLSEAIGITLANVEREQAAGKFAVDMRAEDESGDIVVIENQLERSDHDHLGKLVTYVSALEAKTAVWIVAEPRPEHMGAINWLNETGSAKFFLLKLEAIRIGNSDPAPLLTLITGPSEEVLEVGRTKKEQAGRYEERNRFWQEFLRGSKEKTLLYSNVSAGKDNWIAGGSGWSGVSFNCVIRQHDVDVQLYIDTGDASENSRIFESLRLRTDEIEKNFGEKLEWQPLENRKACRVARIYSLGGYRDPESWPEIQEAMIDGIVRLEKTFKPLLSDIRKDK